MNSPWSLSMRDGIGELRFDQPDSDVNVLTSETMRLLSAQLDGLSTRKDLKALIVTSAKKKIFIAGADIREIESIRDPKDAVEKAEMGKAVFRKLEALPFPT